MKIAALAFRGDCPPLELPDGGHLRAEQYTEPDGRENIYFFGAGETADRPKFGAHVTRVSFRQFLPDHQEGNEAVFLGMMVGRELRGRHLGERLIRYLGVYLAEQGTRFVGSGIMNKPLIALSLARTGLQPDTPHCLVNIMPKDPDSRSIVPTIHVIDDQASDPGLVNYSLEHGFYRIAPSETAEAVDPAACRQVAIHTRYTVVNGSINTAPVPTA